MRPQYIASLLIVLAQLLAGNAGAQATGKIVHDENFFSVFVGGVVPLEESSLTSFSVGADYELRFTPRWGAAALVIVTVGDHPRVGQIALGGTYRPTPKLRLSAWPGIEFVDIPKSDGSTERKAFGLVNVGASYGFKNRGVTIAPMLYFDFFGKTDTNLTFGIAIGSGF